MSRVSDSREIKAFDFENICMTLSDLDQKIDITSASRLHLTLESIAYVIQKRNLFFFTPKTIDLAYKNIKKVVDECQLSCCISILDGSNIICIMRVPATRILNEGIHVGTRLPAAYTSTGRLFMCHMKEEELHTYVHALPLSQMTSKSITDPKKLYNKILKEKNQGYQIVEEEVENGLLSIAAPIFNRENKMIGAMNIGTHLSYKNTTLLKNEVLPMLIKVAEETTAAIKLLQH